MLRLLTIEFHKLRFNKASRVLSIIYFGLLTSIALIAAIKFEFGEFKLHLADAGIFNFPYIWHFNTYVAAILKFFLLLVIVSMMSNEYSYKTLKQNLSDGLSKKEFILSKFYTVIAFAAVSTVFVFFVSLILGIFGSSKKAIVKRKVEEEVEYSELVEEKKREKMKKRVREEIEYSELLEKEKKKRKKKIK